MPPLFVKEVVEALLNRMKVELELAQASGGGSAEWGREGGAAVVATRYETGQLMGSGCVADEAGAVGWGRRKSGVCGCATVAVAGPRCM